eukprot:762021-Hanusia_phi.AAC.2
MQRFPRTLLSNKCSTCRPCHQIRTASRANSNKGRYRTYRRTRGMLQWQELRQCPENEHETRDPKVHRLHLVRPAVVLETSRLDGRAIDGAVPVVRSPQCARADGSQEKQEHQTGLPVLAGGCTVITNRADHVTRRLALVHLHIDTLTTKKARLADCHRTVLSRGALSASGSCEGTSGSW